MQFSLILLGCPDGVPNDVGMFQVSREAWDTGLLHRSIDEPIIHEEVGHTLGDNAQKIFLSTFSREIADECCQCRLSTSSLGIWMPSARYQSFQVCGKRTTSSRSTRGQFLYSLYDKAFMPGSLLARAFRTKLKNFFHFEVGHIIIYAWAGWPHDAGHVWQGHITKDIRVDLFQVIFQFFLGHIQNTALAFSKQ